MLCFSFWKTGIVIKPTSPHGGGSYEVRSDLPAGRDLLFCSKECLSFQHLQEPPQILRRVMIFLGSPQPVTELSGDWVQAFQPRMRPLWWANVAPGVPDGQGFFKLQWGLGEALLTQPAASPFRLINVRWQWDMKTACPILLFNLSQALSPSWAPSASQRIQQTHGLVVSQLRLYVTDARWCLAHSKLSINV